MNTQEWQRVEELLDAALELDPVARRKFLDEASAGAPGLRREVESLIECEEKVDGFLAAPAIEYAPDLFDRGEAPDALIGHAIGPYKVMREIGRGGMGTVYLGRRADDAYQKQVAIKLIKRGMDSAFVLRRFRRERQILASLDHPNIARLLDGGTTDDGRPYFVMEYVEGARIDDYADAHRLSTNARLSLFRQVCAGVQYAHQNLVIHRDLKPSNILVTAGGEAKLLDFGLAKLLDPQGEGGEAHTVTELRAMTPEYASPEQVRGQSVTTASDVYSLGVVLYELLAGHRPYRVKSREPDEFARAVCEQEPERPSASVSRTEDCAKPGGGTTKAVTPETVSRARGERAERLRRRLEGDLDNIVLMAMRKEPQRRYKSAAQFSDDIGRHLAGLPVIARKDTFKYRGAKFVKRNKAGVGAAALLVLILIGGTAATAWQAQRATEQARAAAQERDRARREAAKAERINAFLQTILTYADPSWYSPGAGRGGEVKVIDALNEAARRIETELADQPEVRAELHHTIGNTYRALGRFDLAVPHFRAALELSRAIYGERDPTVARDLYFLSAGLTGIDNHAASEQLLRQAIEMMRATDAENANLPYMLQDLGGMLVYKGDGAAAEPLLREALEMFRRRYGEEHLAVAVSFDRLGLMYAEQGELERAEAMYRKSIETHRRLPNPQTVYGPLWSLGQIKTLQGEYAEAEASL
ncbi:MAG TPA: serine/threonine-protein kinase, partial [Pyrinomonadaceae bacterium]